MAEVFFVGTVAGLIEESITLTLQTGIPAVTNKIIGLSDGYLPLPIVPNWIVNWETPEAAVVTSTNIGIGFKGLFFDKLIGEEEPTVEIPDMVYKMSTHPDAF